MLTSAALVLLMTGVFATSVVNPATKLGGHGLGLVDGDSGQIVNQLNGALMGVGVAVVGSLVALKIISWLHPLRIHSAEEAVGMDLTLHGEEGYNLEA
jgi:Amt family ammonium transporter